MRDISHFQITYTAFITELHIAHLFITKKKVSSLLQPKIHKAQFCKWLTASKNRTYSMWHKIRIFLQLPFKWLSVTCLLQS